MDLRLGRQFAPQAFNGPPGVAERLAQAKHVYDEPAVQFGSGLISSIWSNGKKR